MSGRYVVVEDRRLLALPWSSKIKKFGWSIDARGGQFLPVYSLTCMH